jgi:membrane protein CcdC involved in cytochrome C biogenesis
MSQGDVFSHVEIHETWKFFLVKMSKVELRILICFQVKYNIMHSVNSFLYVVAYVMEVPWDIVVVGYFFIDEGK